MGSTMPTSLAIILGLAGAILIVVGAIGGGFTISTASVPSIGKIPRVVSFTVGAGLIATSIFVFNQEVKDKAGSENSNNNNNNNLAATPVIVQPPSQNPGEIIINMDQAPPLAEQPTADENPTAATIVAPITAPAGYDVNLYWGLDSSASVVATLPDNYQVEIICTAEGQAVTRSDGVTSSLWDGVSVGNNVGGFVPDVYVVTNTSQPTMPNCAS